MEYQFSKLKISFTYLAEIKLILEESLVPIFDGKYGESKNALHSLNLLL